MFTRAPLTGLAALLTLGAAAQPGAAGGADFKAGSFDPPRPAPEFTLQGSDGRELRMSRFRGQVVLLAFGFTSCTQVCPITLATLAQAHRKLGARAAGVQIVYITVDPQRDVPERMRSYLGNFDATFIGGSGSEAQLAAVQRDYGVSAQRLRTGPGKDDYSYAHSSFIYLIDRSGRIRALMPFGHNPEEIVHDVSILLKE
jgi:protein SCO1/2